jgi:HJR/Mrr/RecB family endonuclease
MLLDDLQKPSNVLGLHRALEDFRDEGGTLASTRSVVRFAREFLAGDRKTPQQYRGMAVRQALAAAQLEDDEHGMVQGKTDSSPRSFIHLPETAKLDIRRELQGLRYFAELPDALTPEQLPLARLLTLRMFAGWSLARIAAHDSRPMEHVQADWEAARRWLSLPPPEADGVGTILTFENPDHRLFATIRDHPELLKTLGWREFEKVLAKLLETMGFDIELKRGTKDGGIDIVAVKGDSTFGAHRYLLQAKRWRHRVGVSPVRELLFLKQDFGATKACLATTSTFTRGAWRLAREHRWELELRDFEQLCRWFAGDASK